TGTQSLVTMSSALTARLFNNSELTAPHGMNLVRCPHQDGKRRRVRSRPQEAVRDGSAQAAPAVAGPVYRARQHAPDQEIHDERPGRNQDFYHQPRGQNRKAKSHYEADGYETTLRAGQPVDRPPTPGVAAGLVHGPRAE